MNTDKFGLIVQADGDGGDCAQREGMWFFVKPSSLELNLNNATIYLQPFSGVWIRHPKYPDTKDCSRDQLDPIIMALGKNAQNMPISLKDTFKAHIGRFFFYQNGDWPMLTTPGLYIRAFKAWYLYPILLALDIGFLGAALENLMRSNPDDVDDNNNIMRMTQAAQVYPTPLSSLGRKLYALTRKKNNGNIIKGEKNAVMGALVWYHRAESNGNPEIAEAYRPIVEEYFS